MSILNYFTRTDKETSSNVVIPTGGVPGISGKEIMNITDQVQSTSGVKRKRFTYSGQDKMKNKTRKHCPWLVKQISLAT